MKIDQRKIGRIELRGEQFVLVPHFACYAKIVEELRKTPMQISAQFLEEPNSISPVEIATIFWASQWADHKTPPKYSIEHYGNLILQQGYRDLYSEILGWLFQSIQGWDDTVEQVAPTETPEEKKS